MAEQRNYSNHVKFFPPFHFFAVPILLANFIWSFFRLKPMGYSAYSIFYVVVAAAALVVTIFVARIMALKVQDRVIRLEERLRYQRLLPADLQARFDDFDHRSDRLAAVRQRCGTPDARPQRARRKNQPTQNHQATHQSMEAR